jgi:hypothetical protein
MYLGGNSVYRHLKLLKLVKLETVACGRLLVGGTLLLARLTLAKEWKISKFAGQIRPKAE